jgi:hypothetical protein
MGLSHLRHQLLLGLIAPLALAPALGTVRPPMPASRRASRVAASIAVAVLAAAVAARLWLPAEERDFATAPVSALEALPAEVTARPVFNDYAFGGYLIFAGLKPFIDSRAELYGETFLDRYGAAIEDRCKLAALLAENRIGWTILAPTNGASRLMETLPGWQRLYVDRFAVVHVREVDPAVTAPGCSG